MPHLTLPNLSLHYAEAGAGTPILLIHGHPFDCTSWSPQLDAALPGLRLIAPDLRNFGLTTSPTPPTLFADYARDLLALADTAILTVTGVAFSVSAGMALLRADEEPAEVLQRADEALYLAKRGGRGRLVIEDSPARC